MQRLAKARGGKCLADKYVDARTPIPWECAEKHKWDARPSDIKRGGWCPECAKTKRVEARKLGIERMRQIARERGGKCLSGTYVNNKTKLLWECTERHRWEATPDSIKRGSWCRICGWKKGADARKLGIEEMRRIARERGGECLSDTYVNDRTKLWFKCSEEHQWQATPNSIRNGRWCGKCSSGLGERICREFFEQILRKQFPKSYPKWLINAKGNQMELDGYCQALGLAFEHHGEHHYSTKAHFARSEKVLRTRQEDDRIKRDLCSRQGIVLIEVPEIPTRLPVNQIKTFIKNECEGNGVPLPDDFDTKKINLRKAYATSGARQALKEAQAIAKSRGGKCLSTIYIHAKHKLEWECAREHRWETTLDKIKIGRWCPKCARKMKLTIEEMNQIAKERGGECLSDTYVNNHTNLRWKCAKGYKWEAIPMSIRRGSWCPHCAGNVKQTIEDMRLFAKSMGGKCLSTVYVNAHHKLEWECAKRHRWEAPYNKAKYRWCPECARMRKKSTIEGKREATLTNGPM